VSSVVFVSGLALLAWLAWGVLQRVTRRWSERDLGQRAELLMSVASRGLAVSWRNGDPVGLRNDLVELALSEHVRGVALCDTSGAVVAAAPALLDSGICAQARVQVQSNTAIDGRIDFPSNNSVLASTITMRDTAGVLGLAVVLQDIAYIAGRDTEAQRFVLIAFGILAVAASIFTMLTLRIARSGWRRELRAFLRGTLQRREFRPLLEDVRALAVRMTATADPDALGGWSAARLRETLEANFLGDEVIILANREPYIHDLAPNGEIILRHPASGLVTALEPVMRATSGTWIAHGSGTADRRTADRRGRLRVPPGEESYTLRRIWLTPEEERGYYYGFSNEGLWPLCHLAHAGPVFRASDWTQYRDVNQRFADAVYAEADSDDPVVLVQDYHFALAPAFLRERLPDATIITFWHIPWPNAERFAICPFREDLLAGMLGSHIIGFHTPFHCQNFMEAVDRLLEARIDREWQAVVHRSNTTLVRPYPISVEWPSRWAAATPPAAECRAAVRQELGLRPEALLGVGVDRLDYTKGIVERFTAVERLLERSPDLLGRFTFAELAAPSRVAIPAYNQLNEQVESVAARINERFGRNGYKPILLLRSHHEPPTIYRYYRAADVCYVSSLHDGMNLVAKEFIAARDDEQGVLVLSRFTGAARELTEALLVNPYDTEEASVALDAALRMPAEEQRSRMRALRAGVSEFNVYWWAGQMLVDAARLRRRQRVARHLQTQLATSDAAY
jgi:trehalose 6-phosphate synthase